MKPDYVATKTALRAITFWRIVFCWLIIPAIIMVVDIIKLKNDRIEFYEDHIVVKSGVLNKKERKSAFMGVMSVSVNQSLFGRIFGYGDVSVDVTGKCDVDTRGVNDPQGLVRYLEKRIVKSSSVRTVITE